MHKWLHTFRVSDIWKNDDMTIVEKGLRIAERLRAQSWFEGVNTDNWGALEEIADNLAELPADTDEATEDFDGWWSECSAASLSQPLAHVLAAADALTVPLVA